MFGDYKDDGEVRELAFIGPTVSKKFLIDLVQACRERRSEVKIHLKIAIGEIQNLPMHGSYWIPSFALKGLIKRNRTLKTMGSALVTPGSKTVSKPAYKVRQQVLPAESLLDVFNYVDRRTLDGANVVSPRDQSFHVTVYFKRAYVDLTKGRMYNERNALEMVADDMEEAVVTFFRFLRFCNVSGSIRLYHLRIEQIFVEQLKAVAMHFLCDGSNLELNDVSLADDVHAFDLLLAFPSFRELDHNTYDFLEQRVGNGDDLLKALEGSEFSEAAVLDYLFGDYKDDGEVRELKIDFPALSKKLLINLVQACRERRSELKIALNITTCDDFDVDELAANGEKHPMFRCADSGEPYVWLFRFWGTIRGSARGQ
ncbi:hypothetical protein AAVH_36445 [Aphelenchoides avenae]|nr:hypothetical protein AAVH_36445 [Aphelenchus avenae]